MIYHAIAKPLLFRMDAEKAHNLTMHGLRTAAYIPGVLSGMKSVYGGPTCRELSTELWGMHFPSPLGLAAGLDKNGEAAPALMAMGFGFIEVGTVTPLGQSGNERPRLFRLPDDEALINRMGFNNKGADAMAASLAGVNHHSVPIAVNIGKNKITPNEEAAEDYRICIRKLYPCADMFVVNISSPNTPGLRNLQLGDELRVLLAEVTDEMREQHQNVGGQVKPILVKIAPDLKSGELDYMIDTIVESGVSGVIATNTTLDRTGLTHKNRNETGGLSGKPLTGKSTSLIRAIYEKTNGALPIIGVGGIFTAQDAYDKIRAGASMVEIYTGFIYKGPGLLRELKQGLMKLMMRDGFEHIRDVVGADCRKG